MKRIFTGKTLLLVANGVAGATVILSLIGGLCIDKSMFLLLFLALFFSALSLPTLLNRIYYDDERIELRFISRKLTVKYENIREVFVFCRSGNTVIVLNYQQEVEGADKCASTIQYGKLCREQGIIGTACFGIWYGDARKLLNGYNGRILLNGAVVEKI